MKMDDSCNFALVRVITWCNRFKQRKACRKKIDKELLSIAWHPTRVWHWCRTKDEKKRKIN